MMRANFVHDYVRLEMNDHKKLTRSAKADGQSRVSGDIITF